MFIFIVLVAVVFIIFKLWYSSPQHKGKIGEAKVKNILTQLSDERKGEIGERKVNGFLSQFSGEYKVLNDVVLKTPKGTTQIDHIVISKYGVFAIETKNYRGNIYGDDNRKEWTQIITTDVTYSRKWYKTYTYVTKNHFFNPVKQAYAHVYAIKNVLKEWSHLPVIPIVVFVGSANIDNVKSKSHVIYGYNLTDTIRGYTKIYLSNEDVDNVVRHLMQKNLRDIVDNKTHQRNIQSSKREVNRKISSGICPQCGGSLVKRTGKYGEFYGCSNYPKCKFTTK